MFLSFSGFALVALPLGVLADRLGLRQTLAGMGTTVVVTMLVYETRRRRRLPAVRPITAL